MSYVAVGVAVAGIATSAISARKAAKSSKKQTSFQNQLLLQEFERRERIAKRIEEIAEKILREEPLSAKEQSLISATAKVADTQLQRIQKEAISSGLEAQAGTGFLKSGRMADQVRKIVLEGAEGRSKIALGREQAIVEGINRNRQQALQALGVAGGFQNVPQLQTPVGNPLAGLGAGLTAIGGAGIQGGGFNFGQQRALTQINPNVSTPTTGSDPGASQADIAALLAGGRSF